MEAEKQKDERILRCKYFFAVKVLKEEVVKLIKKLDRTRYTFEARKGFKQRKGTHAVMSRSIAHNKNVNFAGKRHRYSVTNYIVQNELTPRNVLNTSTIINKSTLVRAKKTTKEALIGNHRNDCKYLVSVAKCCEKYGDRCQIIQTSVDSEIVYDGFIFAPRSSIKSEKYWVHNVFTGMTHNSNVVKGLLGVITTLDANDEMVYNNIIIS